MFDFLKNFSVHEPLLHAKDILEDLNSLLQHFEDDYMKDKDAKNAALDALSEFILSLKHKDIDDGKKT